MKLRRIPSLIRKVVIVVLALAAVGTAVAWVAWTAAPYRTEWIAHFRIGHDGSGHIGLEGGRINFGFANVYPPPPSGFENRIVAVSTEVFNPHFGGLGSGATALGHSVSWVWVEPWLLMLLLSTYPTIAFIRGPLRRHRRRKRGLCVACGYNLTGNVTGVCSECGREIATP